MIDRLQLPDGTYELALPMSGDMPIPMADLEADMGKWANALIEAPPGITLVGSTEQITWAEWLLLWAERNGVTARYRRTSPAEYSGRVEGISDAFAEEFQFVEQYGFVGGDPQVVYPNEVFVLYSGLFAQTLTSCSFEKAVSRLKSRASKITSRVATGRVFCRPISICRVTLYL